ncbi:MAG: hypothetical protein OCD01_07545 [Fibrobacterales bacterium]
MIEIKKIDKNTSPVLLFVLSESNNCIELINAMRESCCSKVYVASDGLPTDLGEIESKVLQDERDTLFGLLDWGCEVFIHSINRPVGYREAVLSSIDWFFEHENMGIIMESNCLCDVSWFQFAHECLVTYKDDSRVMSISGNNFQKDSRCDNGSSYYFSQINHHVGWATWKESWNVIPSANEYIEKNFYSYNGKIPRLTHDVFVDEMWIDKIVRAYWSKFDLWDYSWVAAILLNGGLVIIPCVNLVSISDINTKPRRLTDGPQMFPAVQTVSFPLRVPSIKLGNKTADDYLYKYVYEVKQFIPQSVLDSIEKLLKGDLINIHLKIKSHDYSTARKELMVILKNEPKNILGYVLLSLCLWEEEDTKLMAYTVLHDTAKNFPEGSSLIKSILDVFKRLDSRIETPWGSMEDLV